MVYICVCKCMYILAMQVWKDPSGYQRMAPDVASCFRLRQGLLHRPGQPAAKNSPSIPSPTGLLTLQMLMLLSQASRGF